MSRTWICGDKKPTIEQKEIYSMAYEQIQRNTEWLRPGLTYHDLTHKSYQYDPMNLDIIPAFIMVWVFVMKPQLFTFLVPGNPMVMMVFSSLAWWCV